MRGLAGALLLLSSGTALHAKSMIEVPPYEGVYQPKGVDEIGLWNDADESEKQLSNSALLIRDEELTKYVKSVLCKTVGLDRCGKTRVYIMRVPIFNASMDHNGAIRVYSGLLLRVKSEAELGSVLGHEFGHFEKRHGLQRFKKRRSGGDLVAWASILSSSYIQFQNTQLIVYGSYFSFSRENEREADLLGLAYLKNGSLRPQSASLVWQNMIDEQMASAAGKGLKKPKFESVAFFASHPSDLERASYLQSLAGPITQNQTEGREEYREAMKRWLPQFLNDQIKLNDFGASEYIINSLAKDGWTADLWHARGELFRLRGNPRDHVNAVDFYHEAIALDPLKADSYRGLGLSLLKTGQREGATIAFNRFLELSPNSKDASMIKLLMPPDAEIKP